MRRIIIRIAFSLLVASSHGKLLAQKGHGKMGGAGVDATPPAAVHGSNNTSTHTAGASQLSVSDRISNNTGLSTRIQPLIPAGMTLQAASAGFRNQGQFIAALHVSHNLNIPFDHLKAKLTGPNAESLGKAIHDLRPNLDKHTVKSDVKVAHRQAEADLKASSAAHTSS